jgi:hypothetical protein
VTEKVDVAIKEKNFLLDTFSINGLKETVIVKCAYFMNHGLIRCKKEHPVFPTRISITEVH